MSAFLTAKEPTPEQRFWQLWRQGRRPDLTSFLAGYPRLSPEQAAAVIAIDQYERWQTGERILAEEYLPLVPAGADHDQAACDIVYGEYLVREERGEHPDPEEYHQRFPAYAEQLARQFELHRALNEEHPHPGLDDTTQRSQSSGIRPAPKTGRLQPGDSLAPRRPHIPGYEVIEIIGQGGMGVVWKAKQLSLDRTVALKVIDRLAGSDQASLDRLRREAQITARLSHPNIVVVYDAGLAACSDTHPGEALATFYLAMEYVQGIDLHHLVQQRGPLPVAVACDYLRQAALGLQHAHEQGLVHRDLKPSNLIVVPGTANEAGVLKILDLGLARLVSGEKVEKAPLTKDGVFMGTPDFVAPEQANDPRSVDIRSDLYSLGCTFYYLLTGQPPFPQGTSLGKLMQHHLNEPEPVTSVRPEIPADVSTVVHKLLAKRPEDRFQTPAELAEALRGERHISSPVFDTPGGLTMRLSPETQRRSPGLVRKFTGHSDAITDLAFSPLGYRLASASRDQTVRLWDPEPIVLKHPAAVRCLAFAPDGRTLVTGCEDCSLRRWDLATGQSRWTCASHGEGVECVSFLPNGERILSAGQDGTLRLHDATSGQERLTWPAHTGAIWGLALSPDGRWALSGGQDWSLRLWDTASGESLAVLPDQRKPVTCLAVSPDGRCALTGGGDGVIHVWDLARRSERGLLEGHEGRVTSLAFAPDSRLAVSASRDQTVRIWDVEKGRCREVFRGHSRWVTAVAWEPGGSVVASGGADKVICQWETGPDKKESTTS
jgi:WD40 repeat protein